MKLSDLASHVTRWRDQERSRRVVVTLACDHSYAILVAADRPPFLGAGDIAHCFDCRLPQTVRSVSQ